MPELDPHRAGLRRRERVHNQWMYSACSYVRVKTAVSGHRWAKEKTNAHCRRKYVQETTITDGSAVEQPLSF